MLFRTFIVLKKERLGPFDLVSTYALRTLPPCTSVKRIRLACIKPVARIHSEPGSNSFFSRHYGEFSVEYTLMAYE